MKSPSSRRVWLIWVALAGVALLAGPALFRIWVLGLNERPYSEVIAPPLVAATPEPSATPVALGRQVIAAEPDLRGGPVVVDFAHFNQINAAGLQPLAAALAQRGLATRIWLSDVDPFTVESIGEIPDQADALGAQLADASALVVISPYIWWQPGEIDVLESFVADGGRLLLISDPDIVGDAAVYMNLLSERFGIVFNDDYLYDTTRNDENYTHFFLDRFEDAAARLAGSTIAMYGGRSISGDVTAEARSAPTTLSSRRTGVSGFTTVAIGGDSGRGTSGRVLALTDFDVLTEPNVVRFDNQRLVDFTADFLAAGERDAGVADFPASLGKQVTLLIGAEGALSADTLLLGARLQRRLEETGRTLTLAGAPQAQIAAELAPASHTAVTTTNVLTSTPAPTVASAGAAVPPTAAITAQSVTPARAAQAVEDDAVSDRVILADYDYANNSTALLSDVGMTMITELVTPTVAASLPTPATPTPAPALRSDLMPATATIAAPSTITPASDAVAQTATPTPTPAAVGSPTRLFAQPAHGAQTPSPEPSPSTTATPTGPPAPVEVDYLVAEDGLRLLAAETVLVIQNVAAAGHRQVSVLGADNAGISAGVDHLLKNDFSDCIVGTEVTYCPVARSPSLPGSVPAGTSTPQPADTPQADVPAPQPGPVRLLLVDDDAKAKPGERSEADTWLTTLVAAGYTPDLWSTAEKGAPDAATLKGYKWLIWSNGGYADGQIDVAVLDPLFAYMGEGGRITISSRKPFFNMGASPASALRDLVVTNNVPGLVAGLPTDPIALEGDLTNVIPLQEAESGTGFTTIMTRGPGSADSGSPAVSAGTDTNEPDGVGARLIIIGLSTTWLPADVADRFIRNMADWILSDP